MTFDAQTCSTILATGLASRIADALVQVVGLAVPFFLLVMAIHFLEKTIQLRLATRFGWRSVLWTAWLGTPLHELSHVVMCKLFRHRIDDVALFEPDLQAGRLGYVKHSFRRGHWFEEIGNVFIGIAPLIGGSLALAFLLWIFYPEIADTALAAVRNEDQDRSANASTQAWSIVTAIFGGILKLENLLTLRFWVFIYLTLCVGGHMAPSRSDYRGAGRGAMMLGSIALGAIVLLATAGNQDLIGELTQLLGPLLALLTLTVMLCSVATLLVYGLTAVLPRLYWQR
jgi:hypothetical protein